MTYAFTFDVSACSGCKTCQEACKDKNQLPLGILWRRVIEVSGGEWHSSGSAWENNVFAYNLTLACNHCTHPKCAGVCPVDAYTVRPDGIVLIESSRCMGCGYCAWACPYGAPQFDAEHGVMTKCNFCYDYLDAGLPPSCVAACPLRVLDYGTIEELESAERGRNLWQLPATEHPFPLPDYSRTEPHLAIKPHAGMDDLQEMVVSNREEILPPGSFENNQGVPALHELPLVVFTMLIQMAVGMALCSLLLPAIPLPVLFATGILLFVGASVSFLHLGRKRNAWRAVIHLKKSWLSREILMEVLFGAVWVVEIGLILFWKVTPNPWPMAILGLGLIYSMTRIYLLRAVPGWNNWRTPTTFFLSTLILGALGINLAVPSLGWLLIAGLVMVVELALILSEKYAVVEAAGRLRFAILGMGIIVIIVPVAFSQVHGQWQAILLILIALADEVIGRWQFYARRVPFPMHSN